MLPPPKMRARTSRMRPPMPPPTWMPPGKPPPPPPPNPPLPPLSTCEVSSWALSLKVMVPLLGLGTAGPTGSVGITLLRGDRGSSAAVTQTYPLVPGLHPRPRDDVREPRRSRHEACARCVAAQESPRCSASLHVSRGPGAVRASAAGPDAVEHVPPLLHVLRRHRRLALVPVLAPATD